MDSMLLHEIDIDREWCAGVLVCWCAGVLVCWCVSSLRAASGTDCEEESELF